MFQLLIAMLLVGCGEKEMDSATEEVVEEATTEDTAVEAEE
jgi:hypothetical protein